MWKFLTSLMLLALVTTATAAKQEGRTITQEINEGAPIIVIGDRDEGKRLDDTIATGFSAPGYRADLTADKFDGADRAARCAVKGTISSLSLLHQVVDGVYNSATHDRVQQQLVQQTSTCGLGTAASKQPQSSINEDGLLARGAFILEALRQFAPDLKLTALMLANPMVQQRFLARETILARNRLPWDMRYFKVAVCLVQHQPGLAIRLVNADFLDRGNSRLIARMIDRNRSCVGGARKVRFDPIQFRIFVGDALYRWTLAYRAADSLIPGFVSKER